MTAESSPRNRFLVSNYLKPCFLVIDLPQFYRSRAVPSLPSAETVCEIIQKIYTCIYVAGFLILPLKIRIPAVYLNMWVTAGYEILFA